VSIGLPARRGHLSVPRLGRRPQRDTRGAAIHGLPRRADTTPRPC
jgi:hypothetical protein